MTNEQPTKGISALPGPAERAAGTEQSGEGASGAPVSPHFTDTPKGQPQHVLKAEPATADATDRGTPHAAEAQASDVATPPAEQGPAGIGRLLPEFIRSFNVGEQWRVSVRVQRITAAGQLDGTSVEWAPRQPAFLTREQRRDYQRGMQNVIDAMRRHAATKETVQ